MYSRSEYIALMAFVVLLMCGIRGLGRNDRDFFTLHPFSTPPVRCDVMIREPKNGKLVVVPFPEKSYKRIEAASFEAVNYLEFNDAYARAMEKMINDEHPGAQVRIDCTPLYSLSHS